MNKALLTVYSRISGCQVSIVDMFKLRIWIN